MKPIYEIDKIVNTRVSIAAAKRIGEIFAFMETDAPMAEVERANINMASDTTAYRETLKKICRENNIPVNKYQIMTRGTTIYIARSEDVKQKQKGFRAYE